MSKTVNVCNFTVVLQNTMELAKSQASESGALKVIFSRIILGPVVQNFVSLTLLLSPQFVNYIYNYFKRKYTYFFLSFADSHILSTKNINVFVIFLFKILTNR